MRIRDLEIFYWVATLGGFHVAARRLNTTQPNISARVKALEELIGTSLFIRNRQTTTLSPQGNLLLPYAERMLRLREEVMLRVGDPSRYAGILRLGAAESVAHTWLVNLLDTTRRTYPGAVIELTVDTSPHLHAGIEDNTLDLALVMGPSAPLPGIITHHLYDLRLSWLASPALEIDRSVTSDALGRATVIAYPTGTSLYQTISALVETLGMAPEQIVRSNSVATMVRLAVDGVGLAALPPSMVRRELEGGLLEEIKVDWPLPSLDIVALYANGSENPLAAAVSRLAEQVCRETQDAVA